jgi:hypothetical protein
MTAHLRYHRDIQSIDNTPDIDFRLGFGYIPHPVQRR